MIFIANKHTSWLPNPSIDLARSTSLFQGNLSSLDPSTYYIAIQELFNELCNIFHWMFYECNSHPCHYLALKANFLDSKYKTRSKIPFNIYIKPRDSMT